MDTLSELPNPAPQPVPYTPSRQEQQIVWKVYNAFRRCWLIRQNVFHYFDDQTANQYINESVKRFNSFLPRPSTNDRRAHVFMPETRNAVLAILSFMASSRMRVDIWARSDKSVANKKLAKILQGLYDWSMDHENGDQVYTDFVLECLVKGTAILYEGYDYSLRTVKTLTDYDFETGKYKYEEEQRVENDAPISKVIPLEDFFIPNYYEFDLQKQPYVFVREYIRREEAEVRYGHYPKFKYIPTKKNYTDEKQGQLFYWQYWQDRVEDNTVEILHYYNKKEDSHLIVANGLLLNDADTPIIYDHKQYPFSKAVFEKMAVDFFYGKSLPQKILSEQDTYNILTNTNVDRSYASSLMFFFTSLEDEIEYNDINFMERVKVSDPNQIRESNIKPPSAGDIEMMQLMRTTMQNSSLDPSMQGQVSKETATALLQAQEASMKKLGLFGNNMKWGVYSAASQRLANLIQFFPKPNNLKDAKGTKFEVKEARVRRSMLSDGSSGIQIVRLVKDAKDIPSDEEMAQEVSASDENIEIMYITPNMLKNIDWQLKIVPTTSEEMNKALKKAMLLELAQTLGSNPIFAQTTNWEALFDDIVESYNLTPDDLKAEQQPQTQAGQPPIGAAVANQVPEQSSGLVQDITGTGEQGLGQLMQPQQ